MGVAAVTGLASSGLFSGALHWSRNRFIVGYLCVVTVFLLAYARLTDLKAGDQVRRRWRAGLLGGVLFGALLVRSVLRQPSSPPPSGGSLASALLWQGLVYGSLDALLLTIVPVLSVYGTRPPAGLRRPVDRFRWGLAGLSASLFVTAAYHWGFAEFQSTALLQPLIGNGLITLAYLLTGSPIAPLVAHVLMHGAAVLHGAGTTSQLPPHY